MTPRETARRFGELLDRLLIGKSSAVDVVGFIHQNVSSGAIWSACMDTYCSRMDAGQLTGATLARGNAVAGSLFPQGLNISPPVEGLADLVTRLEELRKGASPLSTATAQEKRYLRRWQALNDNDRGPILRDAKLLRDRKKDARTLLTELDSAYRKNNPKAPTLADLLAFDPQVPISRQKFEAAALACELAASAASANKRPALGAALDALDASYAAFDAYLRTSILDPLALIQALRWIAEGSNRRAKVTQRNEQTIIETATWSTVWPELYLNACFHGMNKAVNAWGLKSVQVARGFAGLDLQFLMDPLEGHDRKLLAKRLEFGFSNVEGFLEVQKLRRHQRLVGRYSDLDALDELQTIDLLRKITAIQQADPDEAMKRYVQVADQRVVFRDRYRINQSVLDTFTILWIEGPPDRARVTLELHAMSGVLFETNDMGIGRLVERGFFRELAKNAEALAGFMLAYLQVLGYVLDVATAGASGGLRHIAVEFLKMRVREKITDEVLDAFHIENAYVRTAAGIGANLIHAPKLRGTVNPVHPELPPSSAVTDRAIESAADATAGRGISIEDGPRVSTDSAPLAAKAARGTSHEDSQILKRLQVEAQQRLGTPVAANENLALNAAEEEKALLRSEEQAGERELRSTGTDGRTTSGARDMSMSRRTENVPPDAPARRGIGSSSRSTPPRVSSGGFARSTARPVRPSRPVEPPITPRPFKRMPQSDVYAFLKSNAKSAQYSEQIRQAIKDLPKPPAWGFATRIDEIDGMIRQLHTDNANRALGYGGDGLKPFLRAQRSVSNEGGRVASLLNEGEILSLTGVTKNGEPVEIDGIDYATRSTIENKMNLLRLREWEIEDQMRRQAEFVRDYRMNYVTWEILDPVNAEAHFAQLVRIAKKVYGNDRSLAYRIKINYLGTDFSINVTP